MYKKYRRLSFPPAEFAGEHGELAISYALNTEMILSAYSQGIFPWPYEEKTILWTSPDPRAILEFKNFHLSRSTKKLFRKSGFELRINTAFESVIRACATQPRKGQNGTWITRKMRSAYRKLYKEGFILSFETFTPDGTLAGGLYGVKIGRFFAGESMFHNVTGASKFALNGCVETLQKEGVEWMDIQVLTQLLYDHGAREIPRMDFLRKIHQIIPSEIPREEKISK